MSGVSGVPTTRITDLFVRQRLLEQMQADQKDIFQLQTQLSTGHRFTAPSSDPIAALRVIGLQRLLEQKHQVKASLQAAQSYLSASDTALSRISEIVAEARATALGVMGTTATDEQRAAAALQVQQAIQQLLDAANQKFRGRYLFAGTAVETRPFGRVGNNLVAYRGNDNVFRSYVDTDLLFENNVPGSEIFGAVSRAVNGRADLRPRLRFDTPLSDLRNGQGITLGSIVISDGTRSAVVDLSGAHTIGDVAQLIKRNSAKIALHVEVTANGLRIQLAGGSGDLTIRDVGNGTTARQLGIHRAIGVGTAPIIGDPLLPRLTPATRLADILGAPARAVLRFPGSDNDLILEADRNGEALNGMKIRLVDDPSVAAGNEAVEYSADTRELIIRIDEAHTLAANVVAAVNAAYSSGTIPFYAYLDPTDQEAFPGQGLVFPTPPGEWAAITEGGTGEDFDRQSGLRITNADQELIVDFTDAYTIEDLLNKLNLPELGLIAEIDDGGRSLNIRSRVSGADFAIGENGGKTATQLGVRTLTELTRLTELNYGRGVHDYQNSGQMAKAVFNSVGANNFLILEAKVPGTEWNGYRLRFFDTGAGPGSESVSFDPTQKEVAIGIVPGFTTAARVVELFASTPGARDYFDLRLGEEGERNDGTGLVYVGEATTSGGSSGGADFVITRADGVSIEIDISGAETIGDIINRINSHPQNPPRAPGQPPWLIARLAKYGNGIELIDESVGSGRLTVERTKLSTAAIDLGLVPAGAERSFATSPGSIAQATVTFSGANNDLIVRTRSATAEWNGYRVIIEDANGGPEAFTFDRVNKTLRFSIQPGVTTANRLIELVEGDSVASQIFEIILDPRDGNDGTGLVEVTDPQQPPVITGGEAARLTGRDVRPFETEGIFTALVRLHSALLQNNLPEAERAINLLDRAVLQLNFARAELGAKQQGLDILSQRLEDENLQLQTSLSSDYDADLAEVISMLVAKQSAYQAALQATARIFRMTLLDYL